MTDLTVRISADLPGVIDNEEREDVFHIPETYGEEDIRQFLGHQVESIGARLLRAHALPTPVRITLLGNAARLARLEELVGEFMQDHLVDSSVLTRLRELFLVDAPEAIARWGGPLIEVDEDLDENPHDDEDPTD